jgi:hypothetical protein
MERGHQSIGTHDDRTLWELVVVLVNPSQIVSRRVRLTNGPRREVHNLVPVTADIGVQLRDTIMRPVSPNHGEDMSQSIGSDAESVTYSYSHHRYCAHLVIVPSMSEMTIWSAASQTKIRAVQVTTPVAERENVIEFGPFFKLSSF